MDLCICKVRRIEKETGLLCLEDCIATLAGYYCCDYQLSYIGGYKIEIGAEDHNFATKYSIQLQERFENLKKYHGISILKQSFFLRRTAIKRIRQELQEGRPVLVCVNPYWCPWDDGYQKYDATPGHMFFITDIDKKDFVCCDPYFIKKNIRLSFSLFSRGIQEIYFTEYEPKEKEKDLEIQSALNKMYIDMVRNGYAKKLRQFVEEARQAEDLFCDVFEDQDLWISYLIVFLLKVNQSMQGMATVTDYVGRVTNSLMARKTAGQMWQLAVRWKQARKLMFKLYFIKREDAKLKERTLDRLQCVIDEWEQLARNCPKIWLEKGDPYEMPDMRQWDFEYAEKLHIDLKPYYNNRAFIEEADLEQGRKIADFSSVGTCYVRTERNRVWMSSECPYQVNKVEAGMDNIACDGQRISIPCGIYRKIILIGAAEFGNSYDMLRLYDEQGKRVEDLSFAFTDYVKEPEFGEYVAWRGKGIHWTEDGYEQMPEDLHLYEQRYNLPDKKISVIELPINPSVHIFAMTVR